MVIQPGGTSVGGTQSTQSSSTERPIPPLSNGANPKWVHISIITPGTTGVFRFGQTGLSLATALNGIGVVADATDVIINVAGNTHYRVFAHDATVVYTMTPLAGVAP